MDEPAMWMTTIWLRLWGTSFAFVEHPTSRFKDPRAKVSVWKQVVSEFFHTSFFGSALELHWTHTTQHTHSRALIGRGHMCPLIGWLDRLNMDSNINDRATTLRQASHSKDQHYEQNQTQDVEYFNVPMLQGRLCLELGMKQHCQSRIRPRNT